MSVLLALSLVLNIPAVQTFIVSKVTHSVRKKTGTEISIGSIKIAFPKTVDINDIYFQDQNADTLLYLHSLHVNMDLLRLLHKKVIVNSLQLENLVTHIYRENQAKTYNFQFVVDAVSAKPAELSDTTHNPESPWSVIVRHVELRNIHATFSDEPAGIDSRLDLGDFKVTVKNFEPDQKLADINEILVKRASIELTLAPPGGGTQSGITADSTTRAVNNPEIRNKAGIFPDWGITADQLTIANTNIRFNGMTSPGLPEGIDDQALNIINLNAGIHNIHIDSVGYRAEIKNMQLTESRGLDLKRLAVDAKITGRQMEFRNLQVETSTSKISADARVTYAGLNDLLTIPGNCNVMLDLKNGILGADDVFLFAPALASDSIFCKFKNSDLFISVKAEGKFNDLNLENLEITLLRETALKSHARLTGLPDMTKLGFDITIDRFSTTLTNVYQFVDPAVTAGLNLPESFDIRGNVKGNTGSIHAAIQVITSFGNIDAEAFYQNRGPSVQDTFQVDFTAKDILVGVIVADTLLGETSFSGKAGGSGLIVGPLSGTATLDIQAAQYNAYTYNNIQINSRIDGNAFSISASSRDPNLDFELSADGDLSGVKQKYSARLDLSMLNLRALNLMQADFALTTNLTAELGYSGLNDSEASLAMVNTTFLVGQKSIPVDLLNINAISAPDSLHIQFSTDLADGMINGNINPENFRGILQSAYRKYFGLSDTNRIRPGKHLAFSVNVHIPDDIMGLVIPGLNSLEINKLEGVYVSDGNELSFEMQLPSAIYSNVRLDSLSMIVSGKNESLSLDFRAGKVSYENLQIEKLRVLEQVEKGKILSEIRISDSIGKPKYLFANEIELGDDLFRIRFLPEGLILDSQAWNVDLVFIVNQEDKKMDIDASLENEQNKIIVKGDIRNLSENPTFNMNVFLDIDDLSRLEKYTFNALSDMSGKINGEISLKGTTEKPELNGFIGFEETAFNINSLNFLARISHQRINLNEKGIQFNDFVIEDVQAKKLTVNGDIFISNFRDFEFDLNLVTRDFQPINSTASDNPVFFGKLSLNSDIKLKGEFKSPKIQADIKIDSTTNLTYALPGSELKLVSSEGIVYFLNPSQTHDTLPGVMQGDYLSDSIIPRFSGINLSLNLEIDPAAKFTLDVDPNSGDHLTISGSSKLHISVDTTGKQSITGTYEVKSGFYTLSFYDLVKKNFTIKPGSTVSWSGRPMDADLNITAQYVVTTQSVALMANETSSIGETEKSMFQKSLPYEVSLNIRGLLVQPEISFNITLPEKYLMENPLIAAKLAQLNTQEMASELNKQVFALLVAGTFIADDPMASTGSSTSNIATTAARNSVNGILADQMNKVTNKYVHMVDLNFGLTTYDDGSGGASDPSTELDIRVSKQLFNDRVTVTAQGSFDLDANKNSGTSSSEHNSDEFTITYDLTKNAVYKLKAYYETGYDFFEGDITYSGIAVTFEKEFDSLKKRDTKQKNATKKNKK